MRSNDETRHSGDRRFGRQHGGHAADSAGIAVDLLAAVFVVMPLTPSLKSYLAQILGRRAEMAVWEAADGDRIEHGRVYVAQPDRHLLVANDHSA
jgi:two-component system chemotaxis response regulator CheB